MKKSLISIGISIALLGGVSFAANSTVCGVVSNDYSKQGIVSLMVIPYEGEYIADAKHRTTDKNCVTFDVDWFMQTKDTSLQIIGNDKDNNTYPIENREKGILTDIASSNTIALLYDIFLIDGQKKDFLIGSVNKEIHDGQTVERKYGRFKSTTNINSSILLLYTIGATKYNTPESFRVEADITREQAAKFFVTVANNMSNGKATTQNECVLTDAYDADSTLWLSILNACKMGIMKGSQGLFRPKAPLTLAEAITILIRIKYGMQNEAIKPWYTNYFTKSYEIDLFRSLAYNPHIMLDGNLPISRGIMAAMIERLFNVDIQ